MSKLNDDVSDRVRRAMAMRGLTQHRLALRCGWTQAYLSRRLIGAVEWTTTDIEQVAAGLTLAPWQLLVEVVA